MVSKDTIESTKRCYTLSFETKQIIHNIVFVTLTIAPPICNIAPHPLEHHFPASDCPLSSNNHLPIVIKSPPNHHTHSLSNPSFPPRLAPRKTPPPPPKRTPSVTSATLSPCPKPTCKRCSPQRVPPPPPPAVAPFPPRLPSPFPPPPPPGQTLWTRTAVTSTLTSPRPLSPPQLNISTPLRKRVALGARR